MDYSVSVIIPVYNVEQYVARCARSLFEQSLQKIEYIFINDASTDGSSQLVKDILSEYPARQAHVQFIENARNIGAAGTRNVGLKNATGQYVTFCDADDWIDSSAYTDLYNATNKTTIDLVWCDYYNTFANHEEYKTQLCTENSLDCIRGLLTERLHGSLCNKLFKRSLFSEKQIGFINGLNMWEDLRLSVQFIYFSASLKYVPKAYYHYVQYNDSSLSNANDQKTLTEILKNTEGILAFLDQQQIRGLDEEIQIFKLAAKQTLLFKVEKSAFVKWKNIFPEANSHIWSFSTLPFHLRFLGWASAHNWWFVIHTWIFFKNTKNKILR